MDDVPMFITRKLQPPTEVDIPVDLIQMFQVGSDRGNDSQVYDFTLEKYVCTKISEWVRNTEIDRMNRDERIRLKEIEKARQNEEKHKKLLTAVQYDELSSGEEDEEPQSQLDVEPEKKFSPTHISFDTILQPTIVPNQVNSSSAISSSCKLLNYSDFETIESSPFDNVELKTINDLDILAQILQNTNVHSTDSLKEVENKETNEEERTELEEKTVVEEPEPTPPVIINPPVFPPYYSNHHNGTHASVQNVHLIPDILKGLNNEILQSESRRSQSTDRDVQAMEQEKPKETIVDDNFTSLSSKSQNLVTSICQMGFPKERVIKIVGKLGEKEKEIVDHLIPLSELLDLGFEEQQISDALLKFDNNKEKALDFLIS